MAWHGDRHRHTVDDPVVAIVSVGAAAPVPRCGRVAADARRSFDLGRGDLFVMGGACQHDWEHSVPKVAHAEPRISITYRHGARCDRAGSSPDPATSPPRSGVGEDPAQMLSN